MTLFRVQVRALLTLLPPEPHSGAHPQTLSFIILYFGWDVWWGVWWGGDTIFTSCQFPNVRDQALSLTVRQDGNGKALSSGRWGLQSLSHHLLAL